MAVTVIVELVVPSAVTLPGLDETVETAGSSVAAATAMALLVPVTEPVTVSVAVTVRLPA